MFYSNISIYKLYSADDIIIHEENNARLNNK